MNKLRKLRLSPAFGAFAVTLFLGSEVGVVCYFLAVLAGNGPLRLPAYAAALLATLWFCVKFFWRAYLVELKLYGRERRKAQHAQAALA